jgi:peptide/nickel transport system permease protein
MRNFVARRLLLLAPIMLGVTLLTFLAFRIIPGDVVDIICGLSCSPEDRELIRDEWGLNRPWYVQYGDWLGDAVTGDLGSSFLTHLPVTTELERRLPVTGELMLMTVAMALLLGIPPGIVSAIRPGTPLDWLARFASVLWLSVPSFYLGLLIVIFGFLWFGWTPPQFGRAYVSPFDDPWINVQQFFFPSLVLALGSSAFLMRLTRSSLLEVLRNDYIRTAWSKGLRERSVVWRHAMKNAMIPVVTVLGLEVGGLIGGSVIVESVFALNGMGKYILESIVTRDLFVTQSLVLMFCLVYVAANLVVDVMYAWLDPRIRYS